MEIRKHTLVARRRRLVGRATATLGAVVALSIVMLVFASGALAVSPPTVGLGTAATYAVLAGDSITNTGPTTINGDLGLHPGTSVTGAPTVIGASNVANAAALAAKNDLRTAYLDAEGRPSPTLVAAGALGGLTLAGGLYKDDGAPASLGIATGQTLTLDGQGDPSSVWIFQSASTLITEVSSRVLLINGASPCNVFWQVGSSATLKTSTTFVGTVMAHTSIAAQNSVTVAGRLLAGAQANGAGALTLDTNTINPSTCSTSSDTKPPICVLTASGTNLSGAKYIQVTVQDTGSGLGSVTVDTSTNANTVVPLFTPGTKSPVTITATKVNSLQSSTVQLTVRDRAGNTTVCDPVWSASKITELFNKRGQRVQVHRGLRQAESKISIENGSPGITYVEFVVNGKKSVVRRMRAGQTYKFNVAKAMKPGSNNTIVIRMRGRMGGRALVVVSD